MSSSRLITQGIPLLLTGIVCAVLIALLWLEVIVLNAFTLTDIVVQIRWTDVLVGLTIYLKTSVDFAIFIGNLMHSHPGWKNRVAIEVGTALGNALGTIIVLALWDVFRDIKPLLALMIVWAALVLLKLAQEGLEHAVDETGRMPKWFYRVVKVFERELERINGYIEPVLSRIMPHISMKPTHQLTFWGLFAFAFRIPFILGLDDFAGYVPVFDIVNVLGFGIGVMVGHMILNILLFISPEHTIKTVKHPVISLLGSVAFVLLALYGLVEVVRLLTH